MCLNVDLRMNIQKTCLEQKIELRTQTMLITFTTLDMIFSVTYCSELRNAMSIYFISCILPTNVTLLVWTV